MIIKVITFVGLLSATVVEKYRGHEKCYDYVGCFSNKYPWNCFHTLLMLPDDPAGMKFQYRRYITETKYEVLDYRYDKLTSAK